MSPNAIYSKSGKGVQEASGKTSNLSRADRAVLSAIDGKMTVAEVAAKIGRPFDAKLEQLIQKLDDDGYIRQVSAGTPEPAKSAGAPKAAAPAPVDDLDFTIAMPAPKAAPKPPPPPPAPPVAPDMAKAQADAFAKARAEAEEKAARERERLKAEAEAKMRAELEAKARSEAERKMKTEAEAKLRAEAEAKVKAAREAAVKAAAEAKAKAEAEAERARKEAEEAKRRAEEEARRAREEAEAKAREEAERARREAEEAKRKAEEEARKAREEAERKAKEEAERIRREAEEAKRKAEEEARKAREEAERIRREAEEAKRKAEEEARRLAEEAKRKAEEEARKAREEAERRAKEEAERRAKEEAERVRREAEEAKRRAEEEARKAREEAERVRREAEEAKRRAEEEARRAKEQAERRAREEAEREAREKAAAAEAAKAKAKAKAEPASFGDSLMADLDAFSDRQEEERKAKEEAARKEKEAAERRAREEAERREREERERREREEAERREKERRAEDERRRREEEERRLREEEERTREAIRRAEAERQEAERRRAEAAKAGVDDDDIPVSDDDLDLDDVKQDEELLTKESRRAAREREERERRAKKEAKKEAKRAAREAKEKEKKKEKEREPAWREPPAAPPAFRRPRKWGKPLAMTFLLLLIAGVGALHVLPLSTREYEAAASEATGRPVRIASARLSLYSGLMLKFDGVTIGSTKVAAVRAYPEIGALFGEKKAFSRIELQGVTVPQEALGALFGARVRGPSFSVERIRATNVTLAGPLQLPKLEATFLLGPDGAVTATQLSGPEGLGGKLTPKGPAEMEFDIVAHSFTVPILPDMSLSGFAAKGTATPEGLKIESWGGSSLDGAVQGTADVRWTGGNWSINGVVTVRGINAAVFAPALLSEGRAEGTGRFSFNDPDPMAFLGRGRIEGTFSVHKGVLGSFDLSRAIQTGGRQAGGRTPFTGMSGQGVFDKGAVALRNVSFGAGALAAGASADISPEGKLSGRIVADVRTPSQTLRATLNLGGTVRDPQVRN